MGWNVDCNLIIKKKFKLATKWVKMKDRGKAKEQLVNELTELQQRVAELAASETECKQAEEKLQESEIRYHTLFESVSIAIGLATLDGQIMTHNNALCQMTGYRQEIADLVEGALHNHAYTCLYKPLNMEKILRLVEEIEEKKQKAG